MPGIKSKKSFTLIELLVVISIIALLAAILLPALNQARSKAKQARCVSNLKQLGVAFSLYIQDFEGFIPPVQYGAAMTGNSSYWTNILVNSGYVKAPKWYNEAWGNVGKGDSILNCPDATAIRTVQYSQAYGYIRSNNGTHGPEVGGIAYNITNVNRSSERLLLSDANHIVFWCLKDDFFAYPPYFIRPVHNNGCNVLFMDFHVAWVKADDMDYDTKDFWGHNSQ